MQNIQHKINNKIEEFETNHSQAAPMYYIILSSLIFSIHSLLCKQLTEVPTTQLVYSRALIMLLINTLPVQVGKIQIYGLSNNVIAKLIMRSLFGCAGSLCFYYGLQLISLSEGLVLFRTSPLWTSFIAIYFLKQENANCKLIINLILCILGIIFITQPYALLEFLDMANETESIIYQHKQLGVIIMISAAILSSIIQVLINSLANQVSQLVILQYFSYISTIIPCVLANFNIEQKSWIIPNSLSIILLILVGITSYVSQLLMNRAYIKGQLSQISILGQSQVLFGYILDILSGAKLNWLSVFGSALVVTSLIMIIQFKSKQCIQK